MLQVLLSESDYAVETAGTIEEACTLAATGNFDLYVLDKRLPDGTGMELCERLNRLTPGVPCLFYTGDAYAIHRTQAFEAGATAYVAKPDIETLIQTVHQLLADRECPAEVS